MMIITDEKTLKVDPLPFENDDDDRWSGFIGVDTLHFQMMMMMTNERAL